MTTEHEQLSITKYDLLFESRLTRTEATMDNIDKHIAVLMDAIREVKSDIHRMFGIMLGFSGVLLGLMAKGFHWFA